MVAARPLGKFCVPIPQFQSISTDGGLENLGQSTYNAGLVSLERRFRNGLNLMASYTFSKTLTDADSNYPLFTAFNSGVWAQDSFNLKNNKAVSYQDIPQIFVLSYVYELPVGPNKKFLDKKGVVGKIVGGWQISGVQRYQSGSPISFTCGFPVTEFQLTAAISALTASQVSLGWLVRRVPSIREMRYWL